MTMEGMKFETRSRRTTVHLTGDKVHSADKASSIWLKDLADDSIRRHASRRHRLVVGAAEPHFRHFRQRGVGDYTCPRIVVVPTGRRASRGASSRVANPLQRFRWRRSAGVGPIGEHF